jgi:Family of unknown function (DUF5706)
MEMSLAGLFSIVNEWLRFAESKNAAGVAFNTAIIAVTIDLDVGTGFPAFYPKIVLAFAIVSLGFGLISFLPSLSISRNLRIKVDDVDRDSGNILFFGSIAEMGIENFRRRALVDFSLEDASGLFLPLTEQIFINSVIIRRKLKLFNAAVFFAALGLTFGLSLIVWAVMAKNRDIG